KLPHTAEDVHSLVYSIATEEATPIATHAPNLPRPFREFFDRALARESSARYQTAEDMRQAMRGLSRKLAGKNRNTALHMAAGDTGPLEALPSRPDSQPLRGFREALDDPTGSSRNGQVPQPTASALVPAKRPFAPVAALVAGLALIPALLIQWLRHGGLGQAPGVDTGFAWAGCAGLAVLVAWQLRQRS
ncbi:MAG: hypothetical protein JNK56_24025, partial [Myxococcales bacterium]|nr:hypothetical protein [Myxococcales bacterium]